MKTKLIIMGFIVLLLSACSGIRMVSDQKEGVDFSKYRTYSIRYETELGKQMDLFNELNRNRFEKALHKALAEKGMEMVNDDPDVYVDIATNLEVMTNYSTTYNNAGGRWYFYGGGMGSSNTTEYNTNMGTVVIGLLDGKTEEMLWYSSVSKEVKSNPKRVQEQIKKTVDKLLEVFPIENQKPVEPPVS